MTAAFLLAIGYMCQFHRDIFYIVWNRVCDAEDMLLT